MIYSKLPAGFGMWVVFTNSNLIEFQNFKLNRHCALGKKADFDFNAGKTQLVLLTGLITLALLMQKWMGLLLRKYPL